MEVGTNPGWTVEVARSDDLNRRLQRLDALVSAVESLPDDAARKTAVDTIHALLELHGDGLERILSYITRSGEQNAPLIEAIAADQLVAGLLLLHGVHPIAQEERVARALEKVRPYLGSHGGDVDLLSVEGGVVNLRLRGTCDGCPSSAQTLKYAIEQAILEAAPDVSAIEVDGATPPPQPGFVPLAQILPAAPGRWRLIPELDTLPSGATQSRDVEGAPVLFCRVGPSWYAYADRCPACGGSLAGGTLASTILACPGCGHRYDVRLAGRCQEDAGLNLQPLPLLVESGQVRVAAG